MRSGIDESEGSLKEEAIIDPVDDSISTSINKSDSTSLIQCALCDGRFDSVALLQMHTITMHAPQPTSCAIPSLVCPQCNALLPSLSSFAIHMKSHLSQKTLHCPICREPFRSEEEYLDHLSDHLIVKSMHHSCTACTPQGGMDVLFKEEGEYLAHSMECHAKLLISCTICDCKFEDDLSFKVHSMTQHSESLLHFHCSQCNKSFDSQSDVHTHILSSHSSPLLPIVHSSIDSAEEKESRILQCSVCDEKCKGENALDEHRLFSHCKITRSDSCAECHIPISSRSHFIDHCERHATDSVMSCVVCRQTLRSVEQLNVHAVFHSFDEVEKLIKEEEKEESQPHPITIPPLSIPILPSISASRASPPPKVFRCYVCGFRFNSQSRLHTHIRKHASSLSATCQICGDQFPKQEQLVIHMQSHKQNLAEKAREGIIVNGL